ncbi:hypothetical protein A3C87_01230 [Candidatus Kaiserbacteria bacterium RIFCSPHIGHO2_02_FULL_49_34]|uniref:HD/PDEase domain-containing protein n=1 Tax=Candidatus Kaiserbacteria bacterium RIFCSPHIGHO2_02_FULL_49_34 TaxID=1798491 RepID=A0A1F6DLC5_9BACT|nr:MAG: hypothetical protein A3C87_01230 [Candidatus Kaiserbacteria bacterium RIFCSPHIGHO2_02_FULL_49_34]
MTYSPRVERAIKLAAWLHRDQVRKGRISYPYITHLMSLALMLRDYTDDEDVIIAALLHDALEDTVFTEAELQEEFGDHVLAIVLGVSEWTGDYAQRPSLEVRRARYVAQLKKAPLESLLVSLADKIHNLRSMVEEYDGRPEDFARDFGKADTRLHFYQEIGTILRERLETHPLLSSFDDALSEFRALCAK